MSIIARLMRVVFIVLVFFLVYMDVSAFAIEPDEDDSYVILLDEGSHEIHEDGSSIETIHSKYKILKEEALEELGERKISYLSENEDVKIIKALTIKPNGKKYKAKIIQDVSPQQSYSSYSDQKTKIISMHNLAVGDIIDLEYSTISEYSKIKGEWWGQFYFATSAPIEISRFTLTLPIHKEIYIKAEHIDIEPCTGYIEDASTKTYIWEKSNCQKIELEYMMPPIEDVAPYIKYTTISDWQKIATWYWNASKDKITPTPEITEEVALITAAAYTTKDKISAILRYFQEKFRYVSMSFGINAYEPHRAGEVFENRYGDCKDQTVLLIAMLKSIGVDAYPVLVRYGESFVSLDRVVPSPGEFTHVIAYTHVDGQDLWLDPLENSLDLGDIPYSLTEEKLFVIKPTGGEFIDIPPMPLDRTTGTLKKTIALNEDGSCTGTFETIVNDISAPSCRDSLKKLTYKTIELFKLNLLNQISPGGKVINFSFSDPEDYSQPLSVMISFSSEQWAPRMGDYIILPSLSPNFENPFSLPVSERDHPIQYSSESMKRNISIVTIPKGFKYVYLPEDYEFTSPICTYRLTSQVRDNTLTMTAESHWYPGIVPIDQYTHLQNFFDDLRKESGKTIIIKKAHSFKDLWFGLVR